MPAVSAVNPWGISLNQLLEILAATKEILTEKKAANCYWGIYEFNPVFDNTSAVGAKTLATFLYQLHRRCHRPTRECCEQY